MFVFAVYFVYNVKLRAYECDWSMNPVIMEDNYTSSCQILRSPTQSPAKHHHITEKRAALSDIPSRTLVTRNQKINHPSYPACILQEQASQRSNTKSSKSVTGAQLSCFSPAPSKELEDQSPSSTKDSFGPLCVFQYTPDLPVRDEKQSFDRGFQGISRNYSEARRATLSHIDGQESPACSKSTVISTLYSEQLHNQHFTQLISYLKSLPDPSPFPHQSYSISPSFENLPPHDKPPPDSDIAQLWGVIRRKVAQMSRFNPSDGVSSEPSRRCDIIPPNKKIIILSSSNSWNKDPNEYLELSSINHPRPTNMHNEELDTSSPNWKLMFRHQTFITDVALKYLQNPTRTQTPSDRSQQEDRSAEIQAKFLKNLRFISTPSSSKDFQKYIFSLDLTITLRNKGWPGGSLVHIPFTLMKAPQHGPSFLHLLFSLNQTSSTLLTNWMLSAQEELTNQLRLSRDEQSSEERREAASGMKHFCYLVKGPKIDIWEMKIKIKSRKTSSSTTSQSSIYNNLASKTEQNPSSSSTISANRLLEREPMRASHQEPLRLPCGLLCECQKLWSFDLLKEPDIERFCQVNQAIMKWGQARHGAEYVRSIDRLGERTSSWKGWVMKGTEMQQCWEGIVFGQHDKLLF